MSKRSKEYIGINKNIGINKKLLELIKKFSKVNIKF